MSGVKKIGVIVGREWSFPPAFIEEVNGRDAGVVAEYAQLGGTRMNEPCDYAVLVDRIRTRRFCSGAQSLQMGPSQSGAGTVVPGRATRLQRMRVAMARVWPWLRWGTVAVLLAVLALDLAFPPPLPRAGRGVATVVTAADGTPLRAFADGEGVWRYPASADTVSPLYVQALIGYEDRWFDYHPGVNPFDWGPTPASAPGQVHHVRPRPSCLADPLPHPSSSLSIRRRWARIRKSCTR